jgi:hypothetical protein
VQRQGFRWGAHTIQNGTVGLTRKAPVTGALRVLVQRHDLIGNGVELAYCLLTGALARVAHSQRQIIDCLIGYRRRDDHSVSQIDPHVRRRLSLYDRNDLSLELIARAELHGDFLPLDREESFKIRGAPHAQKSVNTAAERPTDGHFLTQYRQPRQKSCSNRLAC